MDRYDTLQEILAGMIPRGDIGNRSRTIDHVFNRSRIPSRILASSLARRTYLMFCVGNDVGILREEGVGNGIMLRESGTLNGGNEEGSREKARETLV